MSLNTFAGHLTVGDHASRPAANAVPVGALYSCTTHGIIYQSDGASWSNYAVLGLGAAVGDADTLDGLDSTDFALATDLAGYQPLDADLTAIAALTSAADKGIQFTGAGAAATFDLTAAGKALLDDANAAAQRTTLGLGTAATLDSDTDGTLAANSDSKVATQKAVKTYVDSIVTSGASDVMIFKGVIDCSANPNYPAADAGAVYKVSVAGKIGGASGPNVEAGDTLYCITDSTASGNHATVGSHWVIAQVNIDGAALVSGTLAQFAATSSAQLRGVLSDETGTGAAVFADSPTLTNPVVGTQSPGNNTDLGASTAFVTAAVGAATTGVSSVFGRSGAVVKAANDYAVGDIDGLEDALGGKASRTHVHGIDEVWGLRAALAAAGSSPNSDQNILAVQIFGA